MSENFGQLEIISGPDLGRLITLNQAQMKVGRKSGVGIVIEHPSISRAHAEFVCDEGGVQVNDLKSHNGVKVNGSRVSQAALKHGDLINMGDIRMRFISALAPVAVDETAVDEVPPPHEEVNAYQEEADIGPRLKTEEVENTAPVPIREVNEGGGLPLKILMIVAISLALAVLVMTLQAPTVLTPQPVMIKAGEHRLIDLTRYSPFNRGAPDPTGIEVEKPESLRVHFNSFRGKVYSGILDVHATKYGDVMVLLKNSKDEVVAKFKFLVSGEVNPEYSEVAIQSLGNSARLKLAEEYRLSANSLTDSDSYEAWTQYKKAMKYVNTPGSKSELYFEIKEKLKKSKAVVEDELKKLWENFYRARRNIDRKNVNAFPALEVLLSIKTYVHDEKSIDYQRAMIFTKRMKAQHGRKS